MNTLMMAGIIIGLAVIIIGFIISVYNSIIKLKVQTDNAWSQISVQLKRRYDLIPNLIETVKSYAQHEKDTLEKVIQARQLAVNSNSKEDIIKADNQLTGALKSIFALSENYPDLKANQNFLALQEELGTTENKIAFARQFYNDSAMVYNEKIQVFPNSIIAGFFNFKTLTYFEIDATETQAHRVKF